MTSTGTESRRQTGQAPASNANPSLAKPSLLDAVRAFGVTIGPSLLLDFFMGGGVIAVVTGKLAQPPRTPAARLLRPLVALGAGASVGYLRVVRPWMLRWGATDEEVRKPLPGDELVAHPLTGSTRAITVQAPVEEVWPWLAQIGQDRGGFYSYEWLENLAGCEMHNADRIHPEWQQRAVGEIVRLHPATGPRVAVFEPNRAIVLAGWGAFVVEPIDERSTRVILRSRTARGWTGLYEVLLIELPHFIMERKMLLGITARAEQAWALRAAPDNATIDSGVVHSSA